MKLQLTERKIDIGDAARSHAEQRIGKLDKFFSQDAEASLRCSYERGFYTVELTVRHDQMYFRAQDKSGDLVASIDSTANIIERQIRKNKTKLEKRLRAGSLDKMLVPPQTPEEPEEKEYNIVRLKRFDIKPMTVDEAILQMNMVNHKFFAFKNVEDGGRFCVVYHRDDGGYGMIESE